MENQEKKSSIFTYFFLSIISIIFLFIFSLTTSPLYGNYSANDSLVFIVIGKYLKSGTILYKEIFDHKGPYLFFIQALGQLIFEGKLGIFIIQSILLSYTNIILYKTLRLYTNSKKSWISIFISMFAFSFTIDDGNMSEELSLPFISTCLYYACIWSKLDNKSSKKIYLYSFIFGICFGIISLIRLNNALTIFSLSLVIAIYYLYNKKLKNIIYIGLSFIIGLLISCIPAFCYAIKFNILNDMIYGIFIHNFLYMNANIPTPTSLSTNIMICLIFAIPFIINLKKLINNNTILFYFILITLITNIVFSIFSFAFVHYFTLFIPILYLSIGLTLESFNFESIKPLKPLLIIVAITLIFSRLISPGVQYVYSKQSDLNKLDSFISRNIDDDNKNNVLSLTKINQIIYYFGNITPYDKYAFYQQFLIESNNEIKESIFNPIKNNKINYIILTENDAILNDSQEIFDYIKQNYHLIDRQEFHLINTYSLDTVPICIYELNK